MRALPADSLEYFGLTAVGKTALPKAAGAGAGAGAGAAAGATEASAPQFALRKSFHFMPFKVFASLAALYLALHSAMVSAWAEVPCRTTAASTAPAQIAA